MLQWVYTEAPGLVEVDLSIHLEFIWFWSFYAVSSGCVTLLNVVSCFFLVTFQFSHSVVSNSLKPHGLQHTRLPCPSLTPRVYSSSCPSSQWCHPTISSSVVPFSSHCIFPNIRVFSNESVFHIRWPKYWSFSFSISPTNEYSGLISSRIDWLDLLAVQGTLKSLLQHHRSKALILQGSAFLMVQLSCPCVTAINIL